LLIRERNILPNRIHRNWKGLAIQVADCNRRADENSYSPPHQGLLHD
jgi:hypothetical protein